MRDKGLNCGFYLSLLHIMKILMRPLSFITLILLISSVSFAQEAPKAEKKFSFFNRTGLSYTFGMNETFPNNKVNALHIKTVVGLSTPYTGFGIGLENGSYRTTDGSGSAFSTFVLSGNLHATLKPISTDELNFFVKGAAGYAVALSRNNDRGFTYEGAFGGILTTRKARKYFIQALYNYQTFDNFSSSAGKVYVRSIGLGVGTWFN